MIIRNKRGSKTRLNLYLDCCKSTCTPYDILTKYCQHPERYVYFCLVFIL